MQNIDWNRMSAPWLRAEAGLEAMHSVVLDGVMGRAALKDGQRVLDVGCGTGATLLAAARDVGSSGRVVGVDIAPPLVARAQERAPDHVEVVQGDAGVVSFDQPFDAAISMFGTMFFADTAAAFANLRQALSPGAKFVFSAWGPPPRNPWFGIPRAAVEAHVGPLPKPDPAAPGPFRFADAGAVARTLEGVGWDMTVETEELVLGTGQTAEQLADVQLLIVPVALLSDRELDDDDRAAIRSNLRDGFARLGEGETVNVPAVVHFFTGVAA
jgi:SAM-dependent methyltransferase